MSIIFFTFSTSHNVDVSWKPGWTLLEGKADEKFQSLKCEYWMPLVISHLFMAKVKLLQNWWPVPSDQETLLRR